VENRPSLPLEALAEFTHFDHFEWRRSCPARVSAGLVHFRPYRPRRSAQEFRYGRVCRLQKGHMRDSTKAYSIKKWIGNETALPS